VIYVGRPEAAPVAEAYRHLVEANGDLTVAANLDRVGLTVDDLRTEVDDYERCQEIAAAAHQLGCHGVLAPAAHGLGQTLGLFKERISHRELPVVQSQTVWDTLPADPRIPRALGPPRQHGT
jgi:hypothetical protein